MCDVYVKVRYNSDGLTLGMNIDKSGHGFQYDIAATQGHLVGTRCVQDAFDCLGKDLASFNTSFLAKKLVDKVYCDTLWDWGAFAAEATHFAYLVEPVADLDGSSRVSRGLARLIAHARDEVDGNGSDERSAYDAATYLLECLNGYIDPTDGSAPEVIGRIENALKAIDALCDVDDGSFNRAVMAYADVFGGMGKPS